MNNSFSRIYFFLALVLTTLVPLAANGQETWEKEGEGEIKDLKIELTKERQLTLPMANRYFEKVPPRPFEPVMPPITYQVTKITFSGSNYVPTIRPLRIKQEELTKMYGDYISGGIGNYQSFMLDGSIATKRDKKKMLGADFYWRSFGNGPVDDDNSAQSVTKFHVFGNTTTKAALIGGDVSYNNRRGYFYGYTPGADIDRDLLKQVYESLAFTASLENLKKADFSYRLTGGYSRMEDAYLTSESELSLKFDAGYELRTDQRLTLLAEVFGINRQDSLYDQKRNLVRLQPAYTFKPNEKVTLTAGLNMAITNDTFIDGSGSFKVYPHVKVDYQASERFALYALVTGNLEKVNLHTLSAENFWLDVNQSMVHTEKANLFDAGFRANVGNRFSTRLGASFTTFKNPYFYKSVRDPYDPAGVSVGLPVDKFELVYDKSLSQFNPYVEASVYHSDVFSTTLRMDYFSYQTDTLTEPWHRPTYKGDVRLQYNLYNKLHFQVGFLLQGGMKAQDPVSGVVQTLTTATDLNMKVRYFISRQLSAFIQLDNILANQYPIYYNYPARGFQAMVGASLSF